MSLDLLSLDASAIQKLFQEGKTNSVQLVTQILDQIEKQNQAGLKLGAIISVAPRELLLETAAQLDKERQAGKHRGKLHGIPIIVKDSINTHPNLGMKTTAGSWALENSKPARSATVIEKLISKGIIILGKANLIELCNWKGDNTTMGWSAYGGQTVSAYVEGPMRRDQGHGGPTTPGGSSTGSAVGVSAGFSPISIGSETDGSIVQPASRASLFALKPTIGSVSMDGVWPISKSCDALGPMAKSVSDLTNLLEIMLEDEARVALPADGYKSFFQEDFGGLKIGFLHPDKWFFPPEWAVMPPGVREQETEEFEAAISKIKDHGGEVQYPIDMTHPSELVLNGALAPVTVWTYEQQGAVDEYLSQLEKSDVRTLEELILWNEQHSDLELTGGIPDQNILIRSLKERPSEQTYQEAMSFMRRLSRDEGLDSAFKKYDLDLVAMLMDCGICTIASAAGYPIATMPLGYMKYNGAPFGLAIMARAGAEPTMIRFMSAYEAVFPKRKVPERLQTV